MRRSRISTRTGVAKSRRLVLRANCVIAQPGATQLSSFAQLRISASNVLLLIPESAQVETNSVMAYKIICASTNSRRCYDVFATNTFSSESADEIKGSTEQSTLSDDQGLV